MSAHNPTLKCQSLSIQSPIQITSLLKFTSKHALDRQSVVSPPITEKTCFLVSNPTPSLWKSWPEQLSKRCKRFDYIKRLLWQDLEWCLSDTEWRIIEQAKEPHANANQLQWNFSKADTIGTMKWCPLYGSVCFIEITFIRVWPEKYKIAPKSLFAL